MNRISVMSLLVLLTVIGCQPRGIETQKPQVVSFPPTPIIDSNAQSLFMENVAPNAEVNSGITMERASLMIPSGDVPPPSPNYVFFSVYNHTEEAITFVNSGFGVRVYAFDRDFLNWIEVKLPNSPQKIPKTIPPKLEKDDPNILNNWSIPNWDLEPIQHTELRIYIEGVGESTQKVYGAYIDISLQK